MDVVIVEDEPSEEAETPVTIPVVVEVTEDHDVAFAERITRLEMSVDDKADRSDLSHVYERLSAVESRLEVNEAVTEVVVETVVDVLEEQETVEEPTPEPTPPKQDASPRSKRHSYWGKGKS